MGGASVIKRAGSLYTKADDGRMRRSKSSKDLEWFTDLRLDIADESLHC
jgi:hypothetical protein